jgi:3-carboxy-cis,cis-muconate cycloisomerase
VLLAEGVIAAVASLLPERDGRSGKQQLQDVVDQTLRAQPSEQASAYRKLLRATVPAGLLTDLRLEELLDPASYLGQSREIARRILAAYPDFASPDLPASVTDANGAYRG